jgi:hypothetical protein
MARSMMRETIARNASFTCGIMSTMYFRPRGAEEDWRRPLDLILDGICAKRP